MSGNVETIDFGKERREMARMLGRLLDRVEARDADIIANPVKYWKQAAEKIAALQRFVEELDDALRIPLDPVDLDWNATPTLRPQGVMVPREDWDRWRRMEARFRRGPDEPPRVGGGNPCDTDAQEDAPGVQKPDREP
jgi:hypothetical protein